MANNTFSSSSVSLKIGFLILLVVMIVHIIGFSIPRWITFEINFRMPYPESAYHGGLWQHCGCASVIRSGVCLCVSRTNDPGWFKIVQATETLGLIGLVLSVFISAFMLFYKQNKRHKTLNICCMILSGVLIFIGLTWFGIKSREPLNAFNRSSTRIYDEIPVGKLSYAYILCIIAGFLCILVCTPLFFYDLYSHRPPLPETQVYYTPRGQIHVPQHGNTFGGQQPVGLAPIPMQAQYGPPPAYEQYYQPDNSGIPYKS